MEKRIRENLTELYEQHYQEVLTYVRARTDGTIAEEDIVQDAFIKLYAALEAGKTISSPEAWLKTVCRNLLTDRHRAKKNSIRVPPTETTLQPTAHEHGPEDCLLGIIANLPYKYKKAVYLTDVKGLRQIEGAKLVKLPLPTFKSHVQRGRKLVKQGYVECCDYSINPAGKLEGVVKNWEECKVCSSAV